MTIMEMKPPTRVDKEHPWPALLAFTERDADFFGGRESEADETFRAILRDTLTVLYGVSGLGKTSLLRAGVFPLLRAANYFPVHIRLDHSDLALALTDQVKQEIASEAANHGIETPEMPRSKRLWECFHRRGAEFWGARNQLLTPVLVFDQFEEIFTKGGIHSQRISAFLDELADLVTGILGKDAAEEVARDEASSGERRYRYREHRYRVVFALREDFVTQLEALSGRFRSIFTNRVKLLPMSGKAALTSAMRAGGHLMDVETADRIVHVVAGKLDPAEAGGAHVKEPEKLVVEPALLSLFCSELNDRRLAENETRINPTILSTTTRDEILTNFYNRCVGGLGDGVRQFIEDNLLSTDGRTRDTMSVDRAMAEGRISQEVLERLVGSRLLRIEETHKAQRIELSHDVLTSVVRASREQRRRDEQVLEEKKARQEAQQEARAARRAERRAQAWAAVFLVLLIFVIVEPFVMRWFMKKNEAARDYQMAIQHSQSGSFALALAYMARTVRLDPHHPGARAMLSNMLMNRNWPVEILRFTSTDRRVGDISRDGRHLLTLTPNGVEVREAGGKALFPPITIPADADVEFSPSNRGIFVTTKSIEQGFAFSVYDAATGRLVMQHPPSSQPLGPIDLLADGRVVYLDNFEIRVIDSATRTDRSSGIDLTAFAGNLRDIRSGPNGLLVIVFKDNPQDPKTARPQIRDAGRQNEPVYLDRYEGIRFARFRSSGRLIAVADELNNVYVHDTRDGHQISGPKKHDGAIHDVDISPDGKLLVVAYGDNTVALWPMGEGDPVTLRHTDQVASARFSVDGKQIVTASVDGTVRCWSARNGTAIAEMRYGRPLVGAVFTDDTSRILALDADRTVIEWRIVRSHNATDIAGLEKPATRLEVTADGSIAVAAVRDEVVALDATGRILGRKKTDRFGSPFSLNQVDGIVLIPTDDGNVMIWNPRSGADTSLVLDEGIAAAQFSGDGRVIVVQTVTRDHAELRVLDARTREEKGRTATIMSSPIYSVNHSGQRIAVLNAKQLALYDDHGKPVGAPIRLHTHGGTEEPPFAFSKDGTYLVTYTTIDGVQIWSSRTAQRVAGAFDARERVRFAALSDDNQFLVTVGDQTTAVWDWKKKQLHRPRINSDEQNSQARFLTSDRLLTIGPRACRVWDIRDASPISETLHSSVPPAMIGDSMLLTSGQLITRVELPAVFEEDTSILADMAEIMAGLRVNDDGEIDEVKAAKRVSVVSLACGKRSSAVCQSAASLAADPLLRLMATKN